MRRRLESWGERPTLGTAAVAALAGLSKQRIAVLVKDGKLLTVAQNGAREILVSSVVGHFDRRCDEVTCDLLRLWK